MKITEINKIIVKKYPITLQEKWDESGLRYLVSKNEHVTGILLCLDLTQDIISIAENNGINFIISHHPIFLKSKNSKPTKYELSLLKTLKNKKISFASYHTNIDNSPNGLNLYIAKQLNLHQIKILSSHIAIGKINYPYRPKIFASLIKTTFDLERVLYTKENTIKSVAICSGSGFDIFKANINKLKDVDLLVTGDMKWHDWQFAKVHNLHIMDVGHDLENSFINMMAEFINSNIKLMRIHKITNKQNIKIVI